MVQAALTYGVGVPLIWVHSVQMRFVHVVQLADSIHHHVYFASGILHAGLALTIRLNLPREHCIQMRHLWAKRKGIEC